MLEHLKKICSLLKKKASRYASCFCVNFYPILKLSFKVVAGVFSFGTVVLTFLTWEEMNINELWIKVIILLCIPVLSFLISSLLILFVFKTKRIWSQGKNSVSAFYGDLMDKAFPKKKHENCIVVIPVNDTFDTIVDQPSEKTAHPLVSETTIHGMWLNEYLKHFKLMPNELDNRIFKNLEINGYKPVSVLNRLKKPRGNLKRYNLGTVVEIDGDNGVLFYLVAISNFNEINNAHSTKKEIRDAIDSLFDFYDSKGQGEPLYLPLIGTGSSRARLTHKQSLNTIKACVLTGEKTINGAVNIVVYNKDKDKISIFD
jgi:hypothetical protein